DHLAEIHEVLDDLGCLDGHLVGQVGHRDGFRHVNLASDELGRLLFALLSLRSLLLASAATTTPFSGATAPAITLSGWLGATGWLLAARGWCSFTPFGGGVGLGCLLLGTCWLFACLGGLAGGFGRLEHLAWPVQHGPQCGGFGLGRPTRAIPFGKVFLVGIGISICSRCCTGIFGIRTSRLPVCTGIRTFCADIVGLAVCGIVSRR